MALCPAVPPQIRHRTACDSVRRGNDSATFGGLGFDLGYTWLLGAQERVGVSIAAGATRLFGSELNGATVTLPSIRLVNIGLAF
jgi:hypothetical protein